MINIKREDGSQHENYRSLDKNSISLNAAPADKKETLDLAVELMAKAESCLMWRSIVNRSMQERKRVPRESERNCDPHGKCDAVKAPDWQPW